MRVKPIKSLDKIEEMKEALGKCKTKGIAEKTFFEKRRNRALFCTGINSALRVSDIISLELKDVFREDLTFKDSVNENEQKTKKYKEFVVNEKLEKELIDYICCYFYILYGINIGHDSISLNKLTEQEKEQVAEIVRTEPLFPSERKDSEHISRYQVDRAMKAAAEKCGLEQIGTHSMRKTFRLLVLSAN